MDRLKATLTSLFLRKTTGVCVGALLACSALSHAQAGVSAEEIKKLGDTLTPYGAEKAGLKVNDVISIPDWTGGIQKKDWPADYKEPGQHHPNPYADDKPLFVVTADNMDEYAEFIPEGHKSLLKTYPDTFNIPVYQSRRSHSAPQWVYDNVKENAATDELTDDYNGVTGAYGGVPFPILSDDPEIAGVQAIWNHIARFRGVYVTRNSSDVAVYQNGTYELVSSSQEVFFNYYNPEGSLSTLDNMMFYYLSSTHAPARLAGTATLVYEPINHKEKSRQAWTYNAGQRRVRLAPTLAFDALIPASDGLRTADDTDMYNGAPAERYNWKLVGLQTKFIPYNNYKLDDPTVKYDQILEVGHINPDFTRYEAHRVWVVEGQVKDGQRHIYAKRRFYIDEDSWSIASADQYDVRDNLWRVSVAYLKNYYEVPTTWSALEVFHDLQAKRYHVQFLDNEADKILEFANQAPDKGKFNPNQLKRMGRR